MNIVHISDLHLDTVFRKNNILKTSNLLENLSTQGIDHLIITGDISHNANPADYKILKNLLENNGFYSSEKTTVVIGNHDIYGGVITAEDVLDFPGKCSNTELNNKIEEFYFSFEELFDTATFASQENIFPFAKIVGDVVLFGINSIDRYSYLKNLFASNGKVYKSQRLLLEKLINNPSFALKFKIGLIHHHFNKYKKDIVNIKNPLWNRIENATMKLRNKDKLLNFFAKHQINYVFHGHVHNMDNYTKNGISFFNAGSSVDNFITGLVQYNKFTITDEVLHFNKINYLILEELTDQVAV